MTGTTWNTQPSSGDYGDSNNWSNNIPAINDTAFFGSSAHTSISIASSREVAEWVFNPWSDDYTFSFTAPFVNLDFFGAGIEVDGGAVSIVTAVGGHLDFLNNSTAGAASITNNFVLNFNNGSNAGTANITNNLFTQFNDDSSAAHAIIANHHEVDFLWRSSAGSALIDTLSGAQIIFRDYATAGMAQLMTMAGGVVDFSNSSGPARDHHLTVGSIAGAGTYILGGNQLTVGLSALPSNVGGLVTDVGLGGSLVKVGKSTLTLSHPGNTYSGGTSIEQGTLDLGAIGAAGPGAITFAGRATLKIENAALSGNAFGNPIDFFGKHDILDLAGLHFRAGAKATYHATSHHLTVHSGHVTDTLTLVSPLGHHFGTASDHHGGTDVFLVFA